MKYIKKFERKRYFKKDEIEQWFNLFYHDFNKDEFDWYINEGFDINKKNNYKETALYILIQSNFIKKNEKIEIVKLLLDNGADPNIKNHENISPIYFSNIPEITKILIDAGSDINYYTKYGQTPLCRSSYMDSEDNILVFVEAGANLNPGKISIIKGVIERHDKKKEPTLICKLIEKCADLERVDEYIFSKHLQGAKNIDDIIRAIFENQPDYMFKLISYGFDVSDELLKEYDYIFDNKELGLL